MKFVSGGRQIELIAPWGYVVEEIEPIMSWILAVGKLDASSHDTARSKIYFVIPWYDVVKKSILSLTVSSNQRLLDYQKAKALATLLRSVTLFTLLLKGSLQNTN